MMIAFCLALAAAVPSSQERMVAVLPIVDGGGLDAASSTGIEEQVRAAAARVLGDEHVVSASAQRERLGSSRLAPADAARKLSATHVLTGTTRRMEGALAVSFSLVGADGKPFGATRLVGFTATELRDEAGPKIEHLLRDAFGLADSSATPAPLPRGFLRMPVPVTAKGPAAAATPAAALPAASSALALAPAVAPAARVAYVAPAAVGKDGDEPPPLVVPGLLQAAAASPGVEALIREVVVEVEEVRGLRRLTTLQVRILDDKSFARALRAKAQQELTPAAVARERNRWTAFGLAPAAADPAKILLSVLDEQVAGFYDPSTKALTVREHVPAAAPAGGPDVLRLVLAHEIEHALQDQHFGIPDLSAETDDDARLARLSLFEGDAQATMVAVAARRAKRPVKLALAAAAGAMQGMTTEEVLRQSGLSPQLLQAPAVVREELLAPYVAGLTLVAEVHRRGGWALVDRMFQRPPATMHEVLHPAAYLGGERPAPVPFPSAPPGMQAVASGRMGELGTRLALSVCIEDQVARDFTAAWNGDAYTIVRAPGGSLAGVTGRLRRTHRGDAEAAPPVDGW
jgi:hypothetical protein